LIKKKRPNLVDSTGNIIIPIDDGVEMPLSLNEFHRPKKYTVVNSYFFLFLIIPIHYGHLKYLVSIQFKSVIYYNIDLLLFW